VSRADAFPIGAAATLEALGAGGEGEDPHALLARLREHEPVSWLPALGGWLVTRRDHALAVMRDSGSFTVDDPRFSTGRVVGASMLSLDGVEHARHRAPFADPFRRQAVLERFSELVATEADALLDVLEPAGGGELRRGFAGPLAAAVVRQALGLRSTETAAMLGWYDAIVGAVNEITSGQSPGTAGPAAFERLRGAVESVLDSKQGGSLIADAASPAGGLARSEVVSNAAVMMFGGIETTEGMIANAIWHLLGDPAALELVREDPGALENAIEESLRLEPAAATVDRYATADVRLGGASITRGELVIVSIAAANRDPAVFERPDSYEPARSNARLHLAFAHGPHVCIGMHLARLEARSGIERLLGRFPRLRLDPSGDGATPRGLVFRKPSSLRAVWS
jgi:cytochrome P450